MSDDEPTTARYVFCLIAADGASPESLAVQGIEGGEPVVVRSGDVGAVVQPCSGVYESDDLTTVQEWLLAHQRVVDAAGDQFGTPLPMRFNTVIQGTDESVAGWLKEHRDEIADELAAVADHWEYRVHLYWDRDAYEATVREQDEQLADLVAQQADASEGRGFLIEKQYENRLRELAQERRTRLAEVLRRAIEPAVTRMTEQQPSDVFGDRADERDGEYVTGYAVLAPAEDEATLGDALDKVVEEYAVEVTFTGPWPPYTFAPEIG